MKNELYIQNSIAEFVKLIYPLASPIIDVERSASNKYRCIVYMNHFSVPTRPLYTSNYCNNKNLAFVQVLDILYDLLEHKAMDITATAMAMKQVALSQIRRQELIIKQEDGNIKTINNHLSRLQRLRGKSNE